MLISEARKQIGGRLTENPKVQKVLRSLGFIIPENQVENETSPEIPKDTIISYIPNGGKNFAEGLIQKLIESGVLPVDFQISSIFHGSNQRAFLAPTAQDKKRIAENKFKIRNESTELVKGKTVVLVDDSVVRGTNIKTCIKNLLELGVKKVVIVSAAPIFQDGCYLGVALKKEELLSTRAKNNIQSQEEGLETNQTLAQQMAVQLITEINQENNTNKINTQLEPVFLELVFGDIDGIQKVILPNGGFCTCCLS